MTAEQERAAVVAWLRAEIERRDKDFNFPIARAIEDLTDAIEAGEHLPPPPEVAGALHIYNGEQLETTHED